MDETGVKGLIKTNKELIEKKGQLQELLAFQETKNLLQGENLGLTDDEQNLLKLLIDCGFNLDEAIDKRFSELAEN
jgi:hypothetical protein|tara:strand:- start:569 stop:796 length:228 start_codon:yes stop_codon:yes gene_type:complete